MEERIKKRHYSWWSYIKEIVQKYPERISKQLEGVQELERKAVAESIEWTDHMENGKERMQIIKRVHWDRTHTIAGAALEIHCSERTASRWQRRFFEDVARNRGLLD